MAMAIIICLVACFAAYIFGGWVSFRSATAPQEIRNNNNGVGLMLTLVFALLCVLSAGAFCQHYFSSRSGQELLTWLMFAAWIAALACYELGFFVVASWAWPKSIAIPTNKR